MLIVWDLCCIFSKAQYFGENLYMWGEVLIFLLSGTMAIFFSTVGVI
jgi:hypothetical protein